jgi:16S rRNA (guanine966-N2)-methyltransferase
MNSSKRRATAPAQHGRVRIIGGTLRSRVIEVASRPGLRPTPDRVRETLFNWLGQELDGLACLDLFAGSGALGFEAASRGAARVVMVDSDHLAVKSLQENRERLKAAQVEIVQAGALAFLAASPLRFDVVFLDPPFRQNLLPDVMAALPKALARGARVYVEAPQPVAAEGWRELKGGRAGQVHFQLLQRSEP